VYGGEDDETANDVIASDNGYLLVGSTDSFGLNYKDVYVVKIDKNGKVIWERSYGAKYDDEGFAVTKSPDGGYVIVGKTETRRNGTDLYLFKIDAKGNLKWSKNYGDKGDDAGYDIITAEDGYLIVGEKETVSSRYNDVWVLKVDFDGKF
jgi:chemotaxis methyl-accepting protein methylase